MERILIIEGNKTLAKLIAKKITSELHFDVDVAYSASEAKLFLHKYKYFIILSDFNLSDSPDGEIIDYLIEKKNHVIVLSANIDRACRERMLKKQIIDYVNKIGVDDINYIVNVLQRLHKNKEHKILVVDDSMVFRKQVQGMLENLFFEVLSVAHGEEALAILKTHPEISLVLTDYTMPVMDGLELTREIRKIYNKNDLCIIALSSNTEEQEIALFLKYGANDYITKPFSKEGFSCRINNAIEALENIYIITNHANRDFLTGLYNRRYFFKTVESYFSNAILNNISFAIAIINIDNFKEINNKYGHEIGDKVIVVLSEILRSNIDKSDILARFEGEEFGLLVKDISEQNTMNIIERLRSTVQDYTLLTEDGQKIRFTISIGVSLTHEDKLEDEINATDLLLYNAKQNGKNQIVSN